MASKQQPLNTYFETDRFPHLTETRFGGALLASDTEREKRCLECRHRILLDTEMGPEWGHATDCRHRRAR
jgi:hypothetical protein